MQTSRFYPNIDKNPLYKSLISLDFHQSESLVSLQIREVKISSGKTSSLGEKIRHYYPLSFPPYSSNVCELCLCMNSIAFKTEINFLSEKCEDEAKTVITEDETNNVKTKCLRGPPGPPVSQIPQHYLT